MTFFVYAENSVNTNKIRWEKMIITNSQNDQAYRYQDDSIEAVDVLNIEIEGKDVLFLRTSYSIYFNLRSNKTFMKWHGQSATGESISVYSEESNKNNVLIVGQQFQEIQHESQGGESDTLVHESYDQSQHLNPIVQGRELEQTNTAGDASTQIDILVTYTQQAFEDSPYDSEQDFRNYLSLAYDQMNMAFQNSGIPESVLSANVVAVERLDFIESSSIKDDLTSLPTNSQLNDLMKKFGADVAGLVVGGAVTDFCGIGYLPKPKGNSASFTPFHVVNRSCFQTYSHLHEFGHNIGADHDLDNKSNGGVLTDINHGYKVEGLFRTIMSYDCNSFCPRYLNFSNPDIKIGDQVTGDANFANNALVFRTYGPLLAQSNFSSLNDSVKKKKGGKFGHSFIDRIVEKFKAKPKKLKQPRVVLQ